MKKLCIILLTAWSVSLLAQDSVKVEPEHEFKIEMELRPRFEFRYGYSTLRDSSKTPAYFISQRTRLNLYYKRKWLSTYLSLQDVRVWGDRVTNDPRASFSMFQAWADLQIVKGLSVKIGRQLISYDNQRMFAENNWTQPGRAHDALFLKYKDEKTEADLGVSFNQMSEGVFGTDYSGPDILGNYKFLGVLWFKRKMGDFTLSLLNSADGFQSEGSAKVIYVRATDGGRLEFEKKSFYITFSGYLQAGSTQKGEKILAYFFQPEIRYTVKKKLILCAGAEYISGDDAESPNDKFNSFVPPYGTAHRFAGTLDYYDRYPAQVKGAGLVTPYVYLYYKFNDKISLRSDFMLFFLENNYLAAGEVIDKYLGFEQDILFNYQIIKEVGVEAGYSWMVPTESAEHIKGGDSELTPHWAYVMLTVKPTLFTYKK